MSLPPDPVMTDYVPPREHFAGEPTVAPASQPYPPYPLGDPNVPTPQPAGRPRTPTEQADFNARVQAQVDAKRVEAEKAEVEKVANERHDARVKELEATHEAEVKLAEDRRVEDEKRAKFAAHPHTQLRAILKDLQTPTSLDVNGRVGLLQSVVVRLMQTILQHTPGPDEPAPDNAARLQEERIYGETEATRRSELGYENRPE